jgi:hypothetical protein
MFRKEEALREVVCSLDCKLYLAESNTDVMPFKVLSISSPSPLACAYLTLNRIILVYRILSTGTIRDR